jgi:hypothetical protein
MGWALHLVWMVPASARLGETREECVKRYGEPIAEIPALLQNAVGAAFMRGDIRVRIEFLDGKAAFLSFSRRGLRADERQTLVDLNAGSLTWNPPAEFLGRFCWTAPGTGSEAARHASGYQALDTGYLDIATDAWVKAMKAQKAVQFAIVPMSTKLPAAGTKADAPPALPPVIPKVGGKLEGF